MQGYSVDMEVLRLMLGGAAAVCICDAGRALKNGFKAKGAMCGLLDMFSVAAGAGLIWAVMLCVCRGETRAYQLLSIVLGAALYILTIKTVVYRAFYIIFEKIFKILHFIFKILLTPAHFLYKMLCVGFYTITVGKKGDETDAEKN